MFVNPLVSIRGLRPVFLEFVTLQSSRMITYLQSMPASPGSKSDRNQNADDTFITRSGDASYPRYYLMGSANFVRQLKPKYAAYYQQKHNESKTHKHRRVLVSNAYKLVCLVFGLLRDNRNYYSKFRVIAD